MINNIAVPTDLAIHDPSTLVREGDTYWVFGTGHGIPAYSSPDLKRWQPRGSVFATLPGWVRDAVPRLRGDFLWAPDVRRVQNRYLLYYAASTFGSNVSAIGLASSETLSSAVWTDHGLVVQSRAGDGFNAIDPAIALTGDGALYLTFGSFWGGIHLLRLDPTTGLPPASKSSPILIAAHPQERNNAIEAPFIYENGGFFYLFVNWDYCCRHENSTYNIRIGRSRNIEGPYVDRDGAAMRSGGGTLFADSETDLGFIGPGHAGILAGSGPPVFSCHYEWVRAHPGRSLLAIASVVWDRDGWPSLQELR